MYAADDEGAARRGPAAPVRPAAPASPTPAAPPTRTPAAAEPPAPPPSGPRAPRVAAPARVSLDPGRRPAVARASTLFRVLALVYAVVVFALTAVRAHARLARLGRARRARGVDGVIVVVAPPARPPAAGRAARGRSGARLRRGPRRPRPSTTAPGSPPARATLPGIWAATPRARPGRMLRGRRAAACGAALRRGRRPGRGPPAVGVHARRHRPAAARRRAARLGASSSCAPAAPTWPGPWRCRPRPRERERLAARHPRLGAAGARLRAAARAAARRRGRRRSPSWRASRRCGCARSSPRAAAAASRERRGRRGGRARASLAALAAPDVVVDGARPARAARRAAWRTRCAAPSVRALDNVRRHAGADARRGSCSRTSRTGVTVTVRDDGRRLRRRAGSRRPPGEGRLGVAGLGARAARATSAGP